MEKTLALIASQNLQLANAIVSIGQIRETKEGIRYLAITNTEELDSILTSLQ